MEENKKGATMTTAPIKDFAPTKQLTNTGKDMQNIPDSKNDDRWSFMIALCKSRMDNRPVSRKYDWGELGKRLSQPKQTAETVGQYQEWGRQAKDKTDVIRAREADKKRGDAKDAGGFVGGESIDGKRSKASFTKRKILTLDADTADAKFWQCYKYNYPDVTTYIYSTHSHTKEHPRYRLVILMDREVLCHEYVMIANHVMATIGRQYFDETCDQPERLMYWPSMPKYGDFFFDEQSGKPLNADKELADYKESDETEERLRIRKEIAVSGNLNPKNDKGGWIGAFNEAHPMIDVLETILQEYYIPTDKDNRYTWISGSAWGGLLIYDGFAYSNDMTDPANDGHLKNPFDMVRIHLFNDPDYKVSMEKMFEYCRNDADTKVIMAEMKNNQAQKDFSGVEVDERPKWKKDLTLNKQGVILATAPNVELILLNDPSLAGHIKHDDFADADVIDGGVPWRTPENNNDSYWTDGDDAALRSYIEKNYGISNTQKVSDGKQSALMAKHLHFHPIKERIKGTFWDGTPRLDTLLIDYLGAEDTPLNRQFTRKTFVAAVARLFNAGCKVDTVLTLIGKQGGGKSTFVRKMAMGFVNDHFRFVTNADPKTNAEQLRKIWIAEIGELQGFRKAEANDIKAFITSNDDFYRDPYNHIPRSHPRKSIFIATTNEANFLKDDTGDRRWWPVSVFVNDPTKRLRRDPENADAPYLNDDEVLQIWAEAYKYYQDGETWYLTPEMEEQAKAMQTAHSEANGDERRGMVIEYLNTKLPDKWPDWNLQKRLQWLENKDGTIENPVYRYTECTDQIGKVLRSTVSVAEIACECLGVDMNKIRSESKAIRLIMQTLPDWIERGQQTRIKIYGKQRIYQRTGTDHSDEDTPNTQQDDKNVAKNDQNSTENSDSMADFGIFDDADQGDGGDDVPF